MKFGVFLPNGSNGYIMSTAIEPYLPTWELNKAVTIEAERQGLDFVLSMMKFRGFGGETGHWDACLESFSLTAALANVTTRIGLFPSVTLLAQHPAYAARTMATLDDISGGRVGLNIVTGWNKPEYEQMGLWRGDEYYQYRYEYALDYVTIMKSLWEEGSVTYKSRFFDLEDCSCLPRPSHEIPIVSAGQSRAGREFLAKVGGHSFVMVPGEGLHRLAAEARSMGEENGKRVRTYALMQCVADETDDKAWQMARGIVAAGDLGAIRYMVNSASRDTVKDGSSNQIATAGGAGSDSEGLLDGDISVSNMAFMSFPALVGSYETVAHQIDEIAVNPDIEGILWSWPNWLDGIRDFGEKIIPLLECRRGWDVEMMGGLDKVTSG